MKPLCNSDNLTMSQNVSESLPESNVYVLINTNYMMMILAPIKTVTTEIEATIKVAIIITISDLVSFLSIS